MRVKRALQSSFESGQFRLRGKPQFQQKKSQVHRHPIAPLFLVTLMTACATPPLYNLGAPASVTNVQKDPLTELKTRVRTGDIIVGNDLTAISLFMNLATEKPFYYGHSGIVVIESGVPFVYEALGAFNLKAPGQTIFHKIKGGIYKHTLDEFTSRYYETGVFRLPVPERNDLTANAIFLLLQNDIEFDAFFDPSTKEMCCTEWTRAVLQGIGYSEELPLVTRSKNLSVQRAMDALDLKATSYLTADALLQHPGIQPVATVSRLPSLEMRNAMKAAFFYLHERFTTEDNLTKYFTYDAWKVVSYNAYANSYFDFVFSYFSQFPTRDADELRRVITIIYDAHFQTRPQEDK